jgi:hypothetical protein
VTQDPYLPDGCRSSDIPGNSDADIAYENDREKAIQEWDEGEGQDALADAREGDPDLDEDAFAEKWIDARTQALFESWGDDADDCEYGGDGPDD